MFRTVDYHQDSEVTLPTKDPQYRGDGFQHQVSTGAMFTDPNDDRVTFLANIDDLQSPYHRSLSLGADDAATGYSSTHGGPYGVLEIAHNPTRSGNVEGFVQSEDSDTWYTTLRPNAGFPGVLSNDRDYGARTTDVMPANVSTTVPFKDRNHIVAEHLIQEDSRFSRQPAKSQAIYEMFGSAMGQYQWDGSKDEQVAPNADSGPYFRAPLYDGIPSSTGAWNTMAQDNYNLEPQPLTFRAPPTPWDTGPNSDNGRFMNSGY